MNEKPPKKPKNFVGLGDIHDPTPYEFTMFCDIHGPKPYKFISLCLGGGYCSRGVHKPMFVFSFLLSEIAPVLDAAIPRRF